MIAEGDAMNRAIERLVNDIMTRDHVSRVEAERFVVLLLEEFRAVIAERAAPRRALAFDDPRVDAQLVAP